MVRINFLNQTNDLTARKSTLKVSQLIQISFTTESEMIDISKT